MGREVHHSHAASTQHGFELIPVTHNRTQLKLRLGLTDRGTLEVGKAADMVLIDCPPSLGILTINGLTAADEVLIPLQCESLSQRGVGQLLDTIDLAADDAGQFHFRRGEVDVGHALAHRRGEFLVHEADQRLSGRKAADDVLAKRLFPDRCDEILDDGQRDVGFQQRYAHFAQRLLDVRLGEARLAADLLDDLGEPRGQVVEQHHGLTHALAADVEHLVAQVGRRPIADHVLVHGAVLVAALAAPELE